MKQNKLLAGICVGLIGLGVVTTANAALISSYDFNGGLSDTLGNGVDLVASGGSINAGRYDFTNNQGLRLTSALPSITDYGIEIKVQANDSLDGYNKLIDFQDLGSDLGLYHVNGKIQFYTAISSAGNVSLNTDFTLGLARSGGSIEIFLNGVSMASAIDGGNQAVSASNILNFFEDDINTSQNESFAGSVDFIRIHNDSSTFGTTPSAVPVPSAAWLFGSGLLGLIGVAKRAKGKG